MLRILALHLLLMQSSHACNLIGILAAQQPIIMAHLIRCAIVYTTTRNSCGYVLCKKIMSIAESIAIKLQPLHKAICSGFLDQPLILNIMQESTYKDDSPSIPPTDWFLPGMLDRQTDPMPSSLKPFRSHSGADMTLPSLLDCGQPVFADSGPEMNVIQQSQEEVGGDCARRGRHEIVLGIATVVVESIIPYNR